MDNCYFVVVGVDIILNLVFCRSFFLNFFRGFLSWWIEFFFSGGVLGFFLGGVIRRERKKG